LHIVAPWVLVKCKMTYKVKPEAPPPVTPPGKKPLPVFQKKPQPAVSPPNSCWMDESSRKGNAWCKPAPFGWQNDGAIRKMAQLGSTTCPECVANLKAVATLVKPYNIAIMAHCNGKFFEHIQVIMCDRPSPKGPQFREWEVCHGGQNCNGQECSNCNSQTVNYETNEVVGSSMSAAVRKLCCPGGATTGACAPGVPRTIKTVIFTQNIGDFPANAATNSCGGANQNTAAPSYTL